MDEIRFVLMRRPLSAKTARILSAPYRCSLSSKICFVPMDVASFRGLFNYQNIMAGRTLDDGNSDRAKILSKNMIDIASQEDNWKTLIQSLPDKIKQSIEDEQIQQEVRKASIETLGKTIEQIEPSKNRS